MSQRYVKDPDATLDYGIDWSIWLDEDTIDASTWEVPDGLTAESDSHTDTTTTVWLSGGTLGKKYRVTNRVTTDGGRTDDRTLYIEVRAR